VREVSRTLCTVDIVYWSFEICIFYKMIMLTMVDTKMIIIMIIICRQLIQ